MQVDALAAPARLKPNAPMPLFAPLPAKALRTATGWQFTFLNRREECPSMIDWRLGGEGPSYQLWRMNLHYFEWVETFQDDDFVDALTQWITACPRRSSKADDDSWNSYTLSLRIPVWLRQLALRRARLEPAFVSAVAGHCAGQLAFLETHLETDLGGNHLLKNIVALLWGSAALETSRAPRWRALGLRLLSRELEQFLADGMHFERSVSYHAQCVADLLTIRHSLGQNPLKGQLDAAIERGAQLVADLSHPDGGPALFGDSGLSMARSAVEIGEAARAISGKRFAPRPEFDLPQGGYAGLRIGPDILLVDAGPLAPDTLPAHAHGDVGSIEWSVAGERIIVDQGVMTYVAGPARQQSRTASAHNTLSAPGADQGDFFGAFRLGQRCRITKREVVTGDGRISLTVEHSGLVGPRPPVAHRRRIEATRDKIVIIDEIERALPDAAISFLLSPSVIVRQTDNLVELKSAHARCTIVTDGQAVIEPAEWWPDLGVSLPTSRVRVLLHGLSCTTTLSVIDRTAR